MLWHSGQNHRRCAVDLNQLDSLARHGLPKVNFLAIGVDFVATVCPVPFRQCSSLALVLDDFSPTTAVVRTKADFTLGSGHGNSGIANSREIVVEGILEPHTVKDHDSPAP